MKIAYLFEYIFRSQHYHSEFAHLCLLLFLAFLFLNFMQSYQPLLDEKLQYQQRKLQKINEANAAAANATANSVK